MVHSVKSCKNKWIWFSRSLPIYLAINFYSVSGFGQLDPNNFLRFLEETLLHHSNHSKVQNLMGQSGFNLKEINKSQILTLKKIASFHHLITASDAQTGNQNPFWGIPYFWHYVKPNPRNEIILLKTGKKLSASKPPKGFERYQNYAAIDRTPDLFWSDFASEKPKFRYAGIPDFYTFGWCSEREMAFKSILHLMGINCEIVLDGNHVWSVVELDKDSGLWIKVDNTFDEFKKCGPPLKAESDLGKWYNKKAIDPKILVLLKIIEIKNERKKALLEAASKN